MKKFSDLDQVRQVLTEAMDLDEFIRLADKKYSAETGKPTNPIEMVNDHLYKKQCDLDTHPADEDGTRDSTASFTICPPKEMWYCFGCGAGGDRFEYISVRFNVDHIEAINMTAEIEGVDLTPYYAELSPEDMIRENLFKENALARQLAHEALLKDETALAYLRGRGMTDESIELFQLGFAPPANGRISIFDKVANLPVLQLDRMDMFNNAILFPITDVFGRMRYFQSRPFNPLPGMKYIGGNDNHPLYDETDRIFGFHISRKMLYKNGGRIIGVEGAPDTIACIQAGLCACGFLGTVVNQLTFDLLGKYRVVELILLLDGDKAGRDRSFKICEKYLTLQTNVRLRVASLPDGYDPDEFINKYGVDKLKEIVDNAPYAVQYLVDSKWNEAKTPTEKMQFMYDIQKYMNAITDKMVKHIMVMDIAGKMGLDPVQVEDYYVQSVASSSDGKLYALDGEEVLLGQAMRDPDFITELTMRFNDNDWYLARHRYLFKILRQAQYVDVESISTMAKNLNLGEIITVEWLNYLVNKVGNVEFSLKDVEDKLIRRKTIDIVDRTRISANDMTQDITLALDRTTNEMYGAVHKRMDEQIFDAKQQVSSAMKLIHERMHNPNQIIGYEFGDGFKKLSLATLGLQTKTINVVAANQGVGKTTICQNWAMYQAVTQGIPTLWFTLEMDKDRMTFRNLSIISGVPCTAIMTGNLTLEEKSRVDDAAIALENAPFHLSERGHDMTEALSIARRYVNKFAIKIVYVDYAQLQHVSDRKTDQRYRELGWISKGWKEFAKDMDVCVVLISQLSKEALHAEIAEAEHGAGSYEIAQDADTYITLKEKSEDEINQRGIDHGNITMNLSKNRMGQDDVLFDVYADRSVLRMSEC
jgi:DNA primase catalytic core